MATFGLGVLLGLYRKRPKIGPFRYRLCPTMTHPFLRAFVFIMEPIVETALRLAVKGLVWTLRFVLQALYCICVPRVLP